MSAPDRSGRLIRRGFAIVRHHVRLHPRPFVLAVVGALIYAIATIGSSAVIGWVVDEIIRPRFGEAGPGQRGGATVLAGVVAIVAVGLAKCAGIICRRINATRSQAYVQATVRQKVVDKYLDLPLSFFQNRSTGELIARAGQDAEAATFVMAPLPWATGVLVLLVIAAGWLLATDLFLAIIGLVLLPMLLIVNVIFQRRMEAPANLAQDRFGNLSRVAYESIDGAVVVKAFGAEDAETRRFAAAATELRDAKVTFARLQATFDALLNALPSVGIVVLLVVGATRVQSGAVSPGTLVAFANLLNLLAWPLRLVGWVLGDLPRTISGFDRVTGILRLDVPQTGTAHRVEVGSGLLVENISFSHEDGTPALTDVSFDLAPGTTAALVGATGCGKSTLLHVIAGLSEPQSGRIVADRQVALAFQEPFVFADSVEQNVALGRELPVGIYDQAVAVAQAREFIERLPEGSASVIGERGATLSGGQRQRLALARALALQPRLLLLDDATSSVDPATESAILTRLASARDGMTVLMVATRPSTIALADVIVYMEAGRVAAVGPHAELLASEPGYAVLVQAYEEARVAAAMAEGAA